MSTILVSDIFGRTSALEKLGDELPGSVEIVDPYSGLFMEFKEESAAYQFFTENIGLSCLHIQKGVGVIKPYISF